MTISALPAAPSRATDDAATYVTKADAMMSAWPTFVTETNAEVAQAAADLVLTNADVVLTNADVVLTNADVVLTHADVVLTTADVAAAAASALTAVNAPGTNATSTTSETIGTGSRTLTIQTAKSLVAGMSITAADTAAPSTNQMTGIIDSYDTGTGVLIFTVGSIFIGSGTKTAWVVSLASPAGGASLGANTFTGAQIYGDQQHTRAMLIDCGQTYLDKGNSGTSTQTIDLTAGSHQKITTTGAHTIATSNWPPTGNLGELLLELADGNAFAITWPTVSWIMPDGTTTTSISTYLAANTGRTALQTSGTDFLLLWSRDAGTTIYGKLI